MEILIKSIVAATVLLFFTIGIAGIPQLILDIIKFFTKGRKDNEKEN